MQVKYKVSWQLRYSNVAAQESRLATFAEWNSARYVGRGPVGRSTRRLRPFPSLHQLSPRVSYKAPPDNRVKLTRERGRACPGMRGRPTSSCAATMSTVQDPLRTATVELYYQLSASPRECPSQRNQTDLCCCAVAFERPRLGATSDDSERRAEAATIASPYQSLRFSTAARSKVAARSERFAERTQPSATSVDRPEVVAVPTSAQVTAAKSKQKRRDR